MNNPKTQDNGGPAFPVSDLSKTQVPGMTLRDYFAAKAMQAHFIMDAIVCNPPGRDACDMQDNDSIAREAYRTADAMLRAREVTSE